MRPATFTCLFVLLAGLLALPAAHAQLLPGYQSQDGELDEIVAVVEGGVVLKSELDQAVTTVRDQFADAPGSLPPLPTLRYQVLDRLVLQDLQSQRARDMGIRVTQNEVNEAIAGIARQNGLTTQQMGQALAERGMSMSMFQQQVADQILVEMLRQEILRQQVKVSDAEIDNLLASPSFSAGEVHLAHIMILIPQGADATMIEATGAQAAEVRQALADGMDFTAAAIRYSQAQDALDGGDLGWRSLNELPPQFVAELEDLHAGDVTRVLRDPSGFHIFKVLGRRNDGPVVVTEYHARHIAVHPDLLLSNAEAEVKINRLRQRIVDGGEDFAAVAKAESDDDTTANEGGDMGWFPINAWGEAVAELMDALEDGEVSRPFEAAGDWHLIQRLGERQQDRTSEDRRARARQAIQNRKSEEVYNNFLRQLRAESWVDIRIPDPDAPPADATS